MKVAQMKLNFRKSYKLIRNSDENTSYKKVTPKNKTNLNMQSVRAPHLPNISNSQLSPSGSSARKRETPRILSRMFPPFAGITYYRVWAHLASRFVMSFIVMHLFALYSLFLPPLLSDRLWDRRRCWCPDRLRCWRPLLARAIRQAPPWSPDIAYSSLYCFH